MIVSHAKIGGVGAISVTLAEGREGAVIDPTHALTDACMSVTFVVKKASLAACDATPDGAQFRALERRATGLPQHGVAALAGGCDRR